MKTVELLNMRVSTVFGSDPTGSSPLNSKVYI